MEVPGLEQAVLPGLEVTDSQFLPHPPLPPSTALPPPARYRPATFPSPGPCLLRPSNLPAPPASPSLSLGLLMTITCGSLVPGNQSPMRREQQMPPDDPRASALTHRAVFQNFYQSPRRPSVLSPRLKPRVVPCPPEGSWRPGLPH